MEKNSNKYERSKSPNFASNFETENIRSSTDEVGTDFTSILESKEGPIEEEKGVKINEKDTEGFKINFINKNPTKSVSDIRKKFL